MLIVEEADSSVHGILSKDGLFEGTIRTQDGEVFSVERASRYLDIDNQEIRYHSVIYPQSSIHLTSQTNDNSCRSDILHRKMQRRLREDVDFGEYLVNSQQNHINLTKSAVDRNEHEAMDSGVLGLDIRPSNSFITGRRSRDAQRYKENLGRIDRNALTRAERHMLYEGHGRVEDRLKTTCTMYIQADHLFYEKFDSNEDRVIEQLTQHVQGVNDIYRTIGLYQCLSPCCVFKKLKRICLG